MCSSRILDIIETSSIITTWISDNLFHNDDRSLSLSCGTCLPNRRTDILSPEWIVVPSIFIAATPIGASGNSICLLLSAAWYDKVSLSEKNIVFSKCDLPQHPFVVINICKRSILVGSFADLFLTNYRGHWWMTSNVFLSSLFRDCIFRFKSSSNITGVEITGTSWWLSSNNTASSPLFLNHWLNCWKLLTP